MMHNLRCLKIIGMYYYQSNGLFAITEPTMLLSPEFALSIIQIHIKV